MQPFKKTYILLGILIVVILGIFMGNKIMQKSDEAGSIFTKVEQGKAQKLIIHSSSKHVEISKKDGKWVLEKLDFFPADTSEINKVFTKLAAMKRENLISTNPKKQKIFQVDSSNGIQVKVLDKDTMVNIVLGKSGPDYNSTYYRMQGSDEVYLFGESIKFLFDKAEEGWRDRNILKFNKDDLTSISLHYSASVVELEKNTENKWRITRPQDAPVKENSLNSILNTISSLTFKDFEKVIKPLNEYGFDKPECTVMIKLKDNTSKTLLVGKFDEDDNQYYVKVTDSKYIFTVYKYQVDNILKRFEDLKDEEKKEDSTAS